MRHLLNSTRGRLTLLWVAIFAAALVIANVGVYLAVSLLTPRTSDSILSVWTRRLNGSAAAEEDAVAETPAAV